MTNKTIKKQVVFFIFLYYILYCSGPAASAIRETDDEKKHLHLVKCDKKIKKLYWACDNADIILYLIEIRKYTLFYCIKYFSIKRYFFSSIGRCEVTVIGYITI